MITVSDLSLNYSGTPLFSHVDLQFLRGNCYGIIGANGAGKSTFLKILSGDLEASTGTISFHFPVAAYCIMTGAMFQALGHGVLSLINSVIRQLVILLPAAFILSIVGGLDAIWFSFLFAEVASLIVSAIFILRVYRGQIKPMFENA